MRNLRYLLISLRRGKLLFVIAVLQIAVTMFLVNNAFALKNDLDENLARLTKFYGDKKVYFLDDESDNYYITEIEYRKPDAHDRLNKFYHFLKNNDKFTLASIYQASVYMNSFPGDDEFFESKRKTELEGNYYNHFYTLTADEEFFNSFKLEMDSGRMFNHKDFTYNNVVPVILGNKYKKIFKVGDIINGFVFKNKFKLQVIGFLKKGYYGPVSGPRQFDDYDKYIFLPLFKDVTKDWFMFDNVYQATFDMRIFQAAIFTDNEKDAFESIKNKSKELNLYSLSFKRAERIEDIKELYTNQIFKVLIISITVFIFCFIGITTSLLEKINKNSFLYGVHIMCGGRIKDIIFMIICEIFAIVLLALIIAGTLNYIYLKDLKSFLCITPVSLIIAILLSIIPALKCKHLSINTLLRRK